MGMLMGAARTTQTAEAVSYVHPDKLMDRIADAIVDAVLKHDQHGALPEHGSSRAVVEGVLKRDRLILMGEIYACEVPNIERIVRAVWEATGISSAADLSIVDYIVKMPLPCAESLRSEEKNVHGIMTGYATDETSEMLPREFVLARKLWDRALECRDNGIVPWLRAAIKTQVTLDAEGQVDSAAIIAQHEAGFSLQEPHAYAEDWEQLSSSAYEELVDQVFSPVLWEHVGATAPTYRVMGTRFGSPGSMATIGATRRKVVMDAYGPRIPMGGDGYSGKDPTHIERCGSYMARFIAKTIVMAGMARECLVQIAYAIGNAAPVMISAVTEEGRELGDWVRVHFDLTLWAIVERLELRRPNGWSYYDTAAYGHYGYACYPWEKVT